MKRFIKPALAGAGIVLLAAAWLAYQITHPPDLAPYAGRWMPAAGKQSGALRVTFLGVSTLLFDDGETAILTDGFFSRPGKMKVFFGKVAPDPALVAKSLERAGIKRLEAVLVGHSHYDHAMDTPEVAKRTGALVIGSASTAQVARGWGLARERLRVICDGDTLRFGCFQVSFIRSRHVPSPVTGGELFEPLVPPVRANQYHEGGSYSILIQHDGKSLLVQSSAGYVEGALRGRHADVVFLGIGRLGKQDDAYRRAYWREAVTRVGARRVIAIHWDDLFRPLDQPVQPLPRPFDKFDAAMAFLAERERDTRVEVKLAPVGIAIDPWAGL